MTEKEIKIKTLELLYRQLEILNSKSNDEADSFILAKMSDQMGKIGTAILMSKIEDEFSENAAKVMQKFMEIGENPSTSEMFKTVREDAKEHESGRSAFDF